MSYHMTSAAHLISDHVTQLMVAAEAKQTAGGKYREEEMQRLSMIQLTAKCHKRECKRFAHSVATKL